MPRHVKWLKTRAADAREILWLTLHQRRYDTYGSPLETFSFEELQDMAPEQRKCWRAKGWLELPALITPHAPVNPKGDGPVEWCACEECECARAAWRQETGLK